MNLIKKLTTSFLLLSLIPATVALATGLEGDTPEGRFPAQGAGVTAPPENCCGMLVNSRADTLDVPRGGGFTPTGPSSNKPTDPVKSGN